MVAFLHTKGQAYLLAKVVFFTSFLLLFIFSTLAGATTISLSPNVIDLSITAPVFGGGPPEEDYDDTGRLYYTTPASEKTYEITAHWEEGNQSPAGTLLKLKADAKAGQGTGKTITVFTTPAVLISGIDADINTGTGLEDGAQLTYTLEVDNIGALVAGDEKGVAIIFTIQETL